MKLHHPLILTLLVLVGSSLGLEPIRLDKIEQTPNALQFTWSGGVPPFLIQRSADLGAWTDLGQTSETAFQVADLTPVRAFFRVQSLGEPVLGVPQGEWRIGQGEFGEALSKHRLKSIWEFFLPEDQTAATARAFFTTATLRVRYLNGSEMQTFIGRLEALPGATVTAEERKIQATWTWGEGEWERTLSLEMQFPYGVDAIRFDKVRLSDPSVRLRADYQSAKPIFDRSGKITTITSEEAGLVEVDDTGERPDWWNRKMQFTRAGVTIDSRFRIGVPLIEGEPPFVFKTPILVSWEGTTVTGLTSLPIQLHGRFSQTYYPFHHNFIETLWLEPALEPGVDPQILQELEEQNIRFIVPQNPSAFPEQDPTLGVMGFDDVFRDL